MGHKLKFLLWAGILTNLSAPIPTAIVRYMSGDDGRFEVQFEPGTSGHQLDQMIKKRCGIPDAKINMVNLLGTRHLKELGAIDYDLEVTSVIKKEEFRVHGGMHNGVLTFEPIESDDQDSCRYFFTGYLEKPVADLVGMSDLCSLGCQVISLSLTRDTEIIDIDIYSNLVLNEERACIFKAWVDFIYANPHISSDILSSYLGLVCMLTEERSSINFYHIIEDMFPKFCFHTEQYKDVLFLKNQLIEVLQTNPDNFHVLSMKTIMQDAGLDLSSIAS